MNPDSPARAVPILMYHSIAYDGSRNFLPFVVRPHEFARQMEHLQEHKFSPITVSDFARTVRGERASLPERPIVITFDDGYADFYEHALPVLKRYQFPATLYMTTNCVNALSDCISSAKITGRPMLTWDMLMAARDEGIEIGAHSHTHPQLDVITGAQLEREVVEPKQILENRLTTMVTSYAYPHGFHTRQVVQAVRNAGYTSACAVKYAMSSTRDDVFALARILVPVNTSIAVFHRLVRGDGIRPTWRGERFTTRVWRMARRLRYRLASRQPSAQAL
jgi:peptidoglycan/xylan/chitin deacetylase (PgdA/CDA1 family)